MAERDFVHFLGRHEVTAKKAGDGFAMVFGDGSVERERAGANGVPLPAERHDRESVAEKPGVAGVVGEVFVAAIDERKDARQAAIGIFKEERAIAFGGIFWADGDKVRGKFDFAILEVGGVFEVDDGFVVDIVYGDGEKDFAGEPFVRAGVAE